MPFNCLLYAADCSREKLSTENKEEQAWRDKVPG